MDSRCKQRSHQWDNGSQPGSVCTRPGCGARFGEGRRKNLPNEGKKGGSDVTSSMEPPVGEAASAGGYRTKSAPTESSETAGAATKISGRDKLKALWGAGAPAAANDNAGNVVEIKPAEPTLKAPGKTFGKLLEKLSPLAPQIVIAAEASVIRWMGRSPLRPDEEFVEGMREATDYLLHDVLPDLELGPWGSLAFHAGGAFLWMYWGAPKLDDKQLPASPPTTTATSACAPTPATVDDGSSPLSPSPSSVAANDNSIESEPGNATNAPDGPSENDAETAYASTAT
jgi:hypothetical protein